MLNRHATKLNRQFTKRCCLYMYKRACRFAIAHTHVCTIHLLTSTCLYNGTHTWLYNAICFYMFARAPTHARTRARARARTHTHTHTQVSQPSVGGLEEVQDTAIPDVLSSQVRMFVIVESER